MQKSFLFPISFLRVGLLLSYEDIKEAFSIVKGKRHKAAVQQGEQLSEISKGGGTMQVYFIGN
jgi:hypothetical protein